MGYALSYTARIEVYDCITCGAPIALSTDHAFDLKRHHRNYFCPNGHTQHFMEESDHERAERLAAELKRARAERDLARQNEEIIREKEARAREKLGRVKNGVCPNCKRSFTNLRRHMATKHK